MSKKRDLPQHFIAVLVTLLADKLDELKPTSKKGIELLEKSRELQNLLDPIIDNLYKTDGVSKSTYLNDVALKVETVIRKNYKKMD